MKEPTKITDTTAIFTYLELQIAKRHDDTVEQRTKNFKKITSDERSKMTPEKVKQARESRMEENTLKRALQRTKREERFRDAERAKVKRFKSQAGARATAQRLYVKHFNNADFEWLKRGKTVERKRYRKMAIQVAKQWRDKRTGPEKKVAAHLKKTARRDLDKELQYEKDVNEIDSLMYFPLDWGDEGPPSVTDAHRTPKVREQPLQWPVEGTGWCYAYRCVRHYSGMGGIHIPTCFC